MPATPLDRLGAGLDLPQARQKHQGRVPRPAVIQPVLFQGPDHLLRQTLVAAWRLVADGHREAAAPALQQPGIGHLFGQGGQVEGGRHHDQPQLRVQQRPRLAQQGQGQIRLGLPFVELVEDHAVHAFQGRIGLQPPQKHPMGEHLDARGGAAAALQPHAVTHQATHGLAGLCGDPLGGTEGRDPARFQHPHPPKQPGQYGPGHPGGLAGPRGCLEQHRGSGCRHLLGQLGQQGVDRQGGRHRRAGLPGAQRTWRTPSTG